MSNALADAMADIQHCVPAKRKVENTDGQGPDNKGAGNGGEISHHDRLRGMIMQEMEEAGWVDIDWVDALAEVLSESEDSFADARHIMNVLIRARNICLQDKFGEGRIALREKWGVNIEANRQQCMLLVNMVDRKTDGRFSKALDNCGALYDKDIVLGLYEIVRLAGHCIDNSSTCISGLV